ncbi:MAG: hypothetical protein ABW360_06080 [Phenylobacterium sp.]
MTTVGEVRGDIDIGRVIGETFQVLRRNIAAFGLLSLVLGGLPAVALAWLQPGVTHGGTATALYIAFVLITMALTFTLQGALIYGTIQDLSGRRIQFTEALAVGLRNFPGLRGVGLLYFLAVTLGCILLVVPGLMIAVAWAASVQALIVERTGVFAAFGRSAELTRGNRWNIFALVLLYIALYCVLSGVIGALAHRPFFVTTSPAFSAAEAVYNVIVSTIAGLVGAVGGAVLYVELRRANEGVEPSAYANAA